MAKMDYTCGDNSPPPDFLCILWILLFEQEEKTLYVTYFREAELLNT